MALTDVKTITDRDNSPASDGITERAKANIKKLAGRLERAGMNTDDARSIAQRTAENAESPIASDDWMKVRSELFSDDTQEKLAEDFSRDAVLADHNLAEEYASRVFELEGIPDGNGGVEKVKGEVVSGHYEKRGEGGVGIDLVAADDNGVPIPIEIKKYRQTSAAHLENRSVGGQNDKKLEDEVARWKAEREKLVQTKQQGSEVRISREAFETNPSVEHWQRRVAWDELRMAEYKGELPVQQMDDLWTRDRWLKIIKEDEGRGRMRQAGVGEKYLDYDKLRDDPNLPEWQDILDQRTTVIVSDSGGDTGQAMFLQAVQEGRSRAVIKIEV